MAQAGVNPGVDTPINPTLSPHITWSAARRDLLLLILAFVISRAALTGAGVVTLRFLPSTEGAEFTHLLDGGAALDMWYRWDAGFYTSIATYGYDWMKPPDPVTGTVDTADMAFLPVYPLAIHLVSGLTDTGCALSPYLSTCTTLGALLISNVALLIALLLLFDLTQSYFGRSVGWRVALLLLVSPISIFLSGIYTEATFLMLSVLVFWLLARDKFVLAVVTAGIASLTRSVGVALFLPLLWVAWRGAASVRPYRLALAFVPPLLFGGYILFMGVTVGDPLAYFRSYSTTWGRTAGSPLQGFTVYFSGQDVSVFGWERSWLDLLMTLFYLALALILLVRQRTPAILRTWGLFALVALLIPIATGSLLSMPRFGATLFPFYILLARWADRLPKQILVYGGSAALALLMLVRFVTWRWIA
jgi:hypothetical protein